MNSNYFMTLENERHVYTTTEYAEAFRCWLAQQHYIQQMSYYNYQMAAYCNYLPLIFQSINKIPNQTPQTAAPNVNIRNQSNNPTAANNDRGIPCIVSAPWKRYFAEIIDFFFLFIVKIGIAVFICDFMDMQGIEDMIDSVFNQGVNIHIPFEMIYIEIINKIFITLFEAFCLRRGVGTLVGGQTPGKRIMGIKVLSCTRVIRAQGDNVFVFPGKDLGFARSLVRSTLKNIILLFPPLGVTAILFPFYRAFYDRISQSIVVDAELPVRNW